MKIKPEIKDRILSAVNALVAEGVEEPTNQAVLEKMGKGSFSHVSPVMREWRDNRRAETSVALEIPPELKKAVETSLSQVWAAASRLAGVEIEKVKSEVTEKVDIASVERDEALHEITRLEKQVEEFGKQLADKKQEMARLNETLEAERENTSKLKVEKAAFTTRIEDRDVQIQELKAELKAERKNTKSLQAELVTIAKQKGR